MRSQEESGERSEEETGHKKDNHFPIIVIGASTGGFAVIRTIVTALPKDFSAAILIVWHISPETEGMMPYILNREGRLPAANAKSGEMIESGHVYIAPPDHHLIVEDEHLLLTHGPKENRFRPAIDPLFRSAAYHYGSRVIGVILTGALDDGTAGLWAVKNYGGTTIVQDPAEAEASSMPASALRHVQVDYTVTAASIAPLLQKLVSEPAEQNRQPMPTDKLTGIEINIAKTGESFESGIMTMGELTPYTCPECHGVLVNIKEGNISRFRCHTGHAYTSAALLAAITERIEDSLYSAIRGVEESIMLLNHIGDHYAEANKPHLASAYFQKAKEAAERVEQVREAAISHEQLSKENIRLEAEEIK